MNRDFSTATLDYREQLCKEHMRNISYFQCEYKVNWKENIFPVLGSERIYYEGFPE